MQLQSLGSRAMHVTCRFEDFLMPSGYVASEPIYYTLSNLILWLLVSWVFSQPDIFKTTTRIALPESRGSVQTLNLPIPESVVGKHSN